MWRVILFGLLLVVSCNGLASANDLDEKPQPDGMDKEDIVISEEIPAIVSVPAEIPSSSEAAPIDSDLHPMLDLDEIPAAAVEPVGGGHLTRRITYDQRQEGQYNVRADLENFLILFKSPRPMESSSLLDILALAKQSGALKAAPKKSLYADKIRLPVAALRDNPTARISEFIEGRTPYRVDISSAETVAVDPAGRVQPDRQVDVLPPPYPLSYNLMKPYHLEAEPTVVQALPPPKFLDGYNRYADGEGNNYFRLSKSIRADLQPINSNQVYAMAAASRGAPTIKRSPPLPAHIPIVYSSLETLRNVDGVEDIRSRTAGLSLEEPSDNASNNNDVLSRDADELKLIGATEQCGPDRKRDSYGICRFVENY